MASISQEAYCKLIFHSYKYSSQNVFGILVGVEENKRTKVVDAIPLTHGHLLSPTIELALSQVRISSNKYHKY